MMKISILVFLFSVLEILVWFDINSGHYQWAAACFMTSLLILMVLSKIT